ncbi:MAG: D-sedoheptulose 7-phosphate isomerase [Epsilonproteobacteria bacterium]|nr:MAG: D-sedoheptulose 7-phosphate isomerase [Campylobacterota bacterium]
MKKTIQKEFNSHLKTMQKLIDMPYEDIENIAQIVVNALKNDNKILFCGNGGSAADAQHIAAELTGRYKTNRKALCGIALTTDTSALSAIANDFGYDEVFARQIQAVARDGDVLFGISTSGNSQNIINAFKQAKSIGCVCIALSGNNGGAVGEFCDINFVIPSSNTPRIQEMHILIGHTICQIVDDNF